MKCHTFRAALVMAMVACLPLLASCKSHGGMMGDASTTPSATGHPGDIMSRLSAMNDLKSFTGLLEKAGVDDTLKGPGPFTVFAPTDAVLASMPTAAHDQVMKDAASLKYYLLRHIAEGKFSKENLSGLVRIVAMNKDDLGIRTEGTTLTVGGAPLVASDIQCTNGVIHIL